MARGSLEAVPVESRTAPRSRASSLSSTRSRSRSRSWWLGERASHASTACRSSSRSRRPATDCACASSSAIPTTGGHTSSAFSCRGRDGARHRALTSSAAAAAICSTSTTSDSRCSRRRRRSRRCAGWDGSSGCRKRGWYAGGRGGIACARRCAPSRPAIACWWATSSAAATRWCRSASARSCCPSSRPP